LSKLRKTTYQQPVAYLYKVAPMAKFKCAPFLIIYILDTDTILTKDKACRKQMF